MANRSETRALTASGFAVVIFWIGILVGVSFLATPAKFLAPSLSLPIALDVGRHTFAVFNKIEWLLAATLLLLLVLRPAHAAVATGATIAVLIVLVEALWLLHVLDQRVSLIISGQQPPASNLHNIYIAIEVAKLLSLGIVALIMARHLTRS
jgi:hypothetical protein